MFIISTDERFKSGRALTELCEGLIYGAVSEAVLAVVDSLRVDPAAGMDLVRGARLLSERLGEAAAQLEFALRVMEVGSGSTGPPMPVGGIQTRLLGPAIPRRSSPIMDRLLRDAAGPTSAEKDESVADEIDDDDELDALEGGDDLRALLATLPDYRQLPPVAESLRGRYPDVQRVPRQKSRGNAALLVLDKFGRTRSLSLGDLVFAFRTMNVIDPKMSDPDARRLVGWEINELRRRKWPVLRIPGMGFRMVEPEGAEM